MAAMMKLLSLFAIATKGDPQCDWIQNNYNSFGEEYVGNVDSLDECVDLVQTNCPWANIANVDGNVAYGHEGGCFCQHGDDKTVDEWSYFLNCWIDEIVAAPIVYDENGCTQALCTSPSETNPSGDCYAGTRWQGCTCGGGWTAVETGNAGPGDHGHANYEYTCCPSTSGGTTDGTCGDYVRHSSTPSCNQDECNDFYDGCWAGAGVGDPCNCYGSWEARETGQSVNIIDDGEMLEIFEFECCQSGTPGTIHDGTCGNHVTEVAECGGHYEDHLGFGEMKYWTFTTPTPEIVTFTNCHSEHDTQMYLMDSSGMDITSQSTNFCNGDDCWGMEHCDPSESGGSETFTIHLSPGTYQLKLMWYENSPVSGTYEVALFCDSDRCDAHDECPHSQPFCYDHYCSSCDECHTCEDGVDGTCGSCGEGFPLYENPSGGTCSQYVPSDGCNRLHCTNEGGDCWSGYDFHGFVGKCTCAYGWEARETGRSTSFFHEGYSDWAEVFEYECCEPRTGGAHSDGTCGHYEVDDNGCSQQKCTSPSNTEGKDCWAGTSSEGCTCSDGWVVVETGNWDGDWAAMFGSSDGETYYEYTCCPPDSDAVIDGTGTCGSYYEFDTEGAAVLLVVLLLYILAPIIVCVVAIGICIYCCCCRNRNRERLASKAIPMNPVQPVLIAQGMNPPQMMQGQYVQQAIPQMAGPVPPSMTIPQSGLMQQPQWVQPMQSPQGGAQQQVPQQMQFVYQRPEGPDAATK